MRLIFSSNPAGARVIEIKDPRLTIGRVEENDLQLVDEKVSRHHAVIEIEDSGRVVLRDLGSRNGTYVNGQRLSGPCVLSGGERLRFGDELALVEPTTAPGTPAAPRADGGAEQNRPVAKHAAQRARLPAWIRRTPRLIALAIVLTAALVLGVCQLVLPGIAERRLRSELSHHGAVRVLRIEATPAIELLWHRADSVEVGMESYRSQGSGHGSLADFLSRTRDTGRLDVSVGTLHAHLLTLHDVRLRKQGDLLLGQAQLKQQDLSAALPSFLDLRPVSASQNGIVVQVSASLLGHRATVHLRIGADGGRVTVRPQGLPLASLASISVFSDPRIYVESLGAELHGQEYLLTARARLR